MTSTHPPTTFVNCGRAIEAVSSQIDTTKYRLLLKVHQQVYKHAIADKGLQSMLVPNELPTNDMLAVTDVLITDYSSIFIDFLATGRPVLFYAPDIAEYESSRGFYLPFEDWPGPVCREIDELVAASSTSTPVATRIRRSFTATSTRPPGGDTAPTRTVARPTASSTSCSAARSPSTTCGAGSATGAPRS